MKYDYPILIKEIDIRMNRSRIRGVAELSSQLVFRCNRLKYIYDDFDIANTSLQLKSNAIDLNEQEDSTDANTIYMSNPRGVQ